MEPIFQLAMTEGEIQFVEQNIVYNSNFPLYFSQTTSDQFTSFSHTIVARGESPNSNYYPFFYKILRRFCLENKIPLNKLIRCAVNATYPVKDYEFGDPHVDFELDHKILILYLNDLPVDPQYNSTIMFEKTYDPVIGVTARIDEHGGIEQIKKDFKIIKEAHPIKGHGFCFDGKHYHTIRWPNAPHLRYVCVFNFF